MDQAIAGECPSDNAYRIWTSSGPRQAGAIVEETQRTELV